MLMHYFGVGGSSASNLLEPHHRRDSKVCRFLLHELGVVRLSTQPIPLCIRYTSCFHSAPFNLIYYTHAVKGYCKL